MVSRRTFRLVVVFLALIPVQAVAQTPLTADAAVKAALAHNASLRAARTAIDEAAATATQARSGYFPRISVSESWQRGDQPVFVFSSLLASRQFAASNFAIESLNHPDPTGFFRASVGVEQLLYDGGRQRSAATSADLQRTIAAASADAAAAAVALATTQAFGRVVSSDAARRAAEAGLAAAREDLTHVENRRDVGTATEADVLALVVHVATLRQRVLQAAADAAESRAELNRLMGSAVDSAVEIAGLPAELPDEFVSGVSLSALLAEADAARPELKRAAAAEQAAEAARTQTRAALIPQIAAQGAVDVSGTSFNDRASSWIVGGEVRWTFSTGGAETAGTKAAAASLVRTRAEGEAARAAVHVEVISALRRLEAARARQDVGRAAVDQARESQRIVRDRFEAGIAPVDEVLRVSTALLDAEASQVAALVDTMVATAMLRRALGRNPYL